MLHQLSNILKFSEQNLEAIFFDFDGVLVDSVPLKTKAYADIFQPYGEEAVREVVSYHQKHGGIDRYRKISYISEKQKLAFSEEKIEQMAGQFSTLVKEEIIAMPFVAGALDLLTQLKSAKIKLFIVSGTPEEELGEIIERKISKEFSKVSQGKNTGPFFEEVWGSPKTKPEILKEALQRYGFDPRKCLFIGDAIGDFEATMSAGMFFIGLRV